MRTAFELQNDLQLAINVALSCWARMQSDEREMALRLASRYENHDGLVDRDWRKELRSDENERLLTRGQEPSHLGY